MESEGRTYLTQREAARIILKPSGNVRYDLRHVELQLAEASRLLLSACGISAFYKLGELSYPLSTATSWCFRAQDLISIPPSDLKRERGKPTSILYRYEEEGLPDKIIETSTLLDHDGNLYVSEPIFPPKDTVQCYRKIGKVERCQSARRMSV